MRQLTHTPEATEPFPKGHTVATKLHNQMTGADLHPNAIDPTTGTELSVASQAAYDSRYARTTGATITPTSNSTTTLKVTKADGTTQVFDIDTTNARVGLGTTTPRSLLDVTGTGTTEISIDSPAANQAQVSFYKAGVAKWQFYVPGNSNDWRVYGGGADRLTLQNDGKTGLSITPTSMLHVNGAIATAITTTAKTSAYTAAVSDSTILADASGGTFQITLPTAVGCQGRQYTIKRTGATNNMTVGGTSAQTLDGATTKTLGSQNASITVQSDNANWQILSILGTVS